MMVPVPAPPVDVDDPPTGMGTPVEPVTGNRQEVSAPVRTKNAGERTVYCGDWVVALITYQPRGTVTADHVRSNSGPGTFAASATVVVSGTGAAAVGTARRTSVKVWDGGGDDDEDMSVRGGGAPDWRTPTFVT